MIKNKIIRRHSKTLNLYVKGGTLLNMGSSALSLVDNAMQNTKVSDTSDLKDKVSAFGDYKVQSSTNDSLMDEWSNRGDLQHISAKDIRNGSGDIKNALSAAGSGASTGASFGPWGMAAGAVIGGASSLIGSLFGRSKAKKEAKKINNEIDVANVRNLEAYNNAADNIETQNDMNTLANYSAYGGFLKGDNLFSKGGSIHIKPENRGKFNATKQRTGKSTEELTHSKNPLTRKRAIFAQNAAKWHHAYGGSLDNENYYDYNSISANKKADGGNLSTHGGNFSNGLTFIDNGGTHEENPNEGVQMGIDSKGTPNLVEEGEVKFNNYIFSNRLYPNDTLLEEYNLPKSYNNKTFAYIAEKLSKESHERPNDPISQRGLMSSMLKLQSAQETLKQDAASKEAKNKFNKLSPEDQIGIMQAAQQYSQNSQEKKFAEGGFKDPGPMLTGNSDFGLKVDTIPIPKTVDKTFQGKFEKEEPEVMPKTDWGLDKLRYAPVAGAGIAALTDAIGLTNKPNYGNSDLIGKAVSNIPKVEYTPIGNYLQYKPFDKDYYINKLNSQAGATRRAIIDQSGGNRAAATAGILAADYNSQGKLGDLARQAEEYNLAQKQQVESFNRGTNQANSEGNLRASMANGQLSELSLKGTMAQAELRDNALARASAARSTNLSNLFNSLGEVGREEYSRNLANSNRSQYYGVDNSGNVYYKPEFYNLSKENQKNITAGITANGGFLNIIKRRK